MEVAGIGAAALAAEQAIATALEVGAAYTIAKPSLPLKATFSRFAADSRDDGGDRSSLKRCNHTATVIDGWLYIFGGELGLNGKLCGNEVHSIRLPSTGADNAGGPDYRCVPVRSAKEGGTVPDPRKGHQALAVGAFLVISEGSGSGKWAFDTKASVWIPLPETGLEQSTEWAMQPQAVKAGDTVYALSHTDELTTRVDCTRQASPDQLEHASVDIPANPLADGPGKPRVGACCLGLATGHGRHYMLYLFDRENPAMYALQLPSEQTSLSKAKDFIRDGVRLGSGEFVWSRVEVEPPKEEEGAEGKSLPGPLAYYAADMVGNGSGRAVVWGGVDAKGETVGDGWIVQFS